MTERPGLRCLLVAAIAAAALMRATAASGQVGYTGSVYFVKIDTPDGQRTDAVYIFNSVDFEFGRLRGSATLPVIAQQSAWVDSVLGSVNTGWQSGLADPTFRIDADVWRTRLRGTSVRVSGSFKAPVASVDDGYSSGEADVAVGISVSTFLGRNGLLADLSYWTLGDPPGVDYRNVPTIYVGYARVLDPAARWSGIVSVSGSPSVIPGAEPTAQVSAAVLRLLGRGASIGLSFDVGLTDGAADFGIGTTWRVAF